VELLWPYRKDQSNGELMSIISKTGASLVSALVLALLSHCGLCGIPQAQQSVDFASLDASLRAVITNRTATDEALKQSIFRLGPATEPPEFWTQIASDATYTNLHRARAVLALFRRHGQFCGDAVKLSEVLRTPTWMNEGRIEQITYVFGRLPIEVKQGESVFKISVFSRFNVYMRVLGDVDTDTFARLLKHYSSMPNKAIIEYVLDDDYEEWLRGK
jgi:hypothetical protein